MTTPTERTQESAFEDWETANKVISKALVEWFGTMMFDNRDPSELAKAIQSRLVSLSIPLTVAKTSDLRYKEEGTS